MSEQKPPNQPFEVMTGFWLDLKPHAERDAVFVVAQELDLLEVGTTIAKDDVKQVTEWIQKGELARPTSVAMETWDTLQAKVFRFLIVQPYVLIQESGH
jgi:hypothetical protein